MDILVMQMFSGFSLFTVLLLMALGLAVIFGLMGVINMAHGEFMALGAYTTYVTALACEQYLPAVLSVYLFIAGVLAFIVAFIVGYGVEWALIRHLYQRPLDTLLATWGLSLVMQQVFRSVFGAQEVGVLCQTGSLALGK